MTKKLILQLTGTVVLLLSGLGLWLTHRNKGSLPPTPPSVLPRGTKAIIKFDESRHKLSVTTKQGTKVTFARKPEVRINDNDTITTFTHSWGFYKKPFIGVGYSNTGRGYLGCSFVYFNRFDLSGSLGIALSNGSPALEPTVALGYNVYANTSLNLGVNPITIFTDKYPEIAGFLSVRF